MSQDCADKLSGKRSKEFLDSEVERRLLAIDPLRADKARALVGDTPSPQRLRVLKAMAGELSPRQAIKLKCQACVGFEDVNERVGGCTCYSCPLHAYRPYQDSESAGSKNES